MPAYIARAPSGLIKIGWSGRLEKRLVTLARQEGGKLELLREIEGGVATERWFQTRYAPYRARGRDWFKFVPDMLTVTPPDGLSPVGYRRISYEWRERGHEQRRQKIEEIRKRIPLIEALCDLPSGAFGHLVATAGAA